MEYRIKNTQFRCLNNIVNSIQTNLPNWVSAFNKNTSVSFVYVCSVLQHTIASKMKYQLFKNSKLIHSDSNGETYASSHVHQDQKGHNNLHYISLQILFASLLILLTLLGILVASIFYSSYFIHHVTSNSTIDSKMMESQNSKQNECIYELFLGYMVGAPDGVTKQMLTFNGQFPGPTLRCEHGKFLVVRVTNNLDEPTSVHWHGIEQNLSPFYDGPEGITQCPIMPGTSMLYRFQLFQSGTYWYHSHHSQQYVDGAWGILVIDNVEEVWSELYDEELIITLNDWHHLPSKVLFERYISNETDFPVPDSHLINGKGIYNCTLARAKHMDCTSFVQSPSIIKVRPGRRYRLRVINTSATTRFNFSIDGHQLQTIETDGVDTVLVPPVDIVPIWTAQRYSFILTTKGSSEHYWIRAAGNFNDNPGMAVLKYDRFYSEKDDDEQPNVRKTKHLHLTQGRPAQQSFEWDQITHDRGCGDVARRRALNNRKEKFTRFFDIKTGIPAVSYNIPKHLSGTTPSGHKELVILNQNDCRPFHNGGQSFAPDYFDRQITINAQNCYGFTDNKTRLCLNNIQYIPGNETNLPVLFQMIAGGSISSSMATFHTPYLNEVVQVVINNRNVRAHPWHMHGHTFWVVGTGEPGQGDYIAERDARSLITNCVRRDSTHSPENSWLVLRYFTGNPGAWFLHCHISWHLGAGLGAVLIEGQQIAQDLYCDPPEESRKVCAHVK